MFWSLQWTNVLCHHLVRILSGKIRFSLFSLLSPVSRVRSGFESSRLRKSKNSEVLLEETELRDMAPGDPTTGTETCVIPPS